jgi:signal peptidase I
VKSSRWVVWVRGGFWLVVVLLVGAVLWATRGGQRIPSLYIQTGNSMEPTVVEGQYFVAWKPPDRLEPGDLVVFRYRWRRGELHVLRRLAGLPGDTVAMDSGVVVLNGQRQPWPFGIYSPGAWRSELAIELNIYTWGPWVVPADSAVLLADRRDMHGWPDSRFLGFIALDEILARVDLVFGAPAPEPR